MANTLLSAMFGCALAAATLAAPLNAAMAGSTSLTVTEPLKTPSGVLNAGTYQISLDDRLTDRAIVRISGPGASAHSLLLAVPSKGLKHADGSAVVTYQAKDGGKVLAGWFCKGCKEGLEFVYPKDDAVTIAKTSGKAVLAMDPSYDKLPAAPNMSGDDMKVVTLWMVSPQRLNPADGQYDIAAGKYQATPAATTQSASAAAPKRKSLPHTAGTGALYLLLALGATICAFMIRLGRTVLSRS